MKKQLVRTIVHPTDFSETSMRAFAQALAIALLGDTKLIILHVGPEKKDEVDWSSFPPVRKTLERWGLLKPNSPRTAVFDGFNMRVGKFAVRSRHPVLATVEYMKNDPVDLIVLGTERHDGFTRLKDRSDAEAMARWSKCMTLFVPSIATRGVVSQIDGSGGIKNILVPVDSRPDPRTAIDSARRTATALGDAPVNITLLQVGNTQTGIMVPADDEECSWQKLVLDGDPVEQILLTANQRKSDLIVMATAGHDSVLDVFRGSTTEQVLRRASCPLLAVPA